MKLLKTMSPSSFLIVHGKHDSPVCPHQVTPETPLDEINLNWQEHNLPERERIRHVRGLPPCLGKFISQLAEVFLRKFFTPGPTVPDPFAGSGTRKKPEWNVNYPWLKFL